MEDFFVIPLQGGLGDHIAFLNILPEIKKQYKKYKLAVCFPDVFVGEDVISIWDCSKLYGNDYLNKYNVYKWMTERNWKGSLVDAYRKMYLKNTIVISPYSKKMRNNKENPKNYPYWWELCEYLKQKDYYLVQVGTKDENQIKNVDEMKRNLSFEEMKELVENCYFWISVDNFMGHLGNFVGKRGCVIFGKSDPNIFGYKNNVNILKDRSFLRKNQFDIWEKEEFDENVFTKPKDIIEKLEL